MSAVSEAFAIPLGCYPVNIPASEIGLNTYRPVTLLVDPSAEVRLRDYVVCRGSGMLENRKSLVWIYTGGSYRDGTAANRQCLQGAGWRKQDRESFKVLDMDSLPALDRVAAIILNPGAPSPLKLKNRPWGVIY